MKRIFFVAEDLFPLGPSQSLIRQIHDLAAAGTDVHVGLLNPLPEDLSRTIPATVHRISDATSRTDASNRGLDSRLTTLIFNRRNFAAIFQIRKLIKSLQPDRVHPWGTPAAIITLAAAQATAAAEIPELVFSEYFLRPSSEDGKESASIFFRRKFSRALVADERIGRQVIDRDLADKTEVVPNRVLSGNSMFPQIDRKEAIALLRSELGLSVETKIAMTVAPLIAQTRIKDLIWATDLLAVIRNDLHLVIFGCGPQYADLKRFSSLTEADQHIHFLGRPRNAWQLFHGGDVFWHSHLLEPEPVNMLNAMSLSIPVVSVFGDGTSSVIKHQTTGLGTNFGARDEFARWTKYILELPEKAEQLGNQGRSFVESEFRDSRPRHFA